MLKKIGVAAILLLILVSLTIGSVGSMSGQAGTSGTFMGYGHGLLYSTMRSQHPDVILPPFASSASTSVTLDFSGQETDIVENATWHPPELMPPGEGCYFKPGFEGNREYISGRMIVQPPGSGMPRYFPVKFFRHPAPNGTEKPFMFIYRMDPTTFKYDDVAGSNFTLGGEILVTNGSIVQANLTGDQYGNEIAAGQTIWHQAQATGSSTAFNFDLKWNNTKDNLTLTVYTPDGHILGPYTDTSDGKKDGRINMELDNTAGTAAGTWSFKVADTNVTGKDEYYLRTW